jgi:hypothetical protein
VSHVSVAATLLELAGQPVPRDLDGASAAAGPPDGTLFAEARQGALQWRAAIRGDTKWVVAVRPDRSIAERRHYALERELGSHWGGHWSEEAPALALLERVARDPDPGGIPEPGPGAAARRDRRGAGEVAPGVDAETLQRLRALGYADPDAPDGSR